ncbi:MAG: DUF2073 domain-containing protein [Candidatus Micrarchaeota archaeon]
MKLHIEFISRKALEGKDAEEKVSFILAELHNGKRIVVLEQGLTRQEEKTLISRTMEKVTNAFPGIEISSFGEEPENFKSALIRLLGGKTSGLTVVGPSNLVKEIKRDPQKLRVFMESK